MRLSFAFVLLLLPACETFGERAITGRCPPGETCSAATPDGLRFGGPPLGDDWLFADPAVKATAVGGTQDITIDGLGALAYRAELGSDAITADPPVGVALALHGAHDGDAYLRIVDPATGELYDRTITRAETITRIALFPAAAELVDHPDSIALRRGTSVSLVAQLYGADGARLVDQGMTITGGDRQSAWDTAEIAQVPADQVVLTVRAGARPPSTASLPVVDGIDAIVVDVGMGGLSPKPGESAFVCFDGHAGAATVVGLGWTITATNADNVSPFTNNCIIVERDTAGRIAVRAEADGLAIDLPIDVVAPAGARKAIRGDNAAAIAARFPARDLTPGERAAAAE